LVNDWISDPLASRDYKDCGTDSVNPTTAKLALHNNQVASTLRSGGSGGIPSSRGEHLVLYENPPNDSRIATKDTCPTLGKRIGAGGGNLPLVQSTVGALQERDYKGTGTTVDDKLILHRANGRSSGRMGSGIGKPNDPSPTLSENHHHGVFTENTGMSVRRLTPRECERLMGFPDDFTRIPYRGKGIEKCPDGPRYAALGNSIAVPVLKWIGDRIQLVEEMT